MAGRVVILTVMVRLTVLDDAFILVANLGRSVTTPSDMPQTSQFATSQSAAVQKTTVGDDEEVSVTTANSRDIVFASFDDESDEEFDRPLSLDASGNAKVGLARQLTLS